MEFEIFIERTKTASKVHMVRQGGDNWKYFLQEIMLEISLMCVLVVLGIITSLYPQELIHPYVN